MLGYLARTLTDGSPHVNEMIDQVVADAEGCTADAEGAGLVRPSADPRARVVGMGMWALRALVMHEHLRRLLGVDLVDGAGPPLPYFRAAQEICAEGVLTEGAYEQLRAATDVASSAAAQEPGGR